MAMPRGVGVVLGILMRRHDFDGGRVLMLIMVGREPAVAPHSVLVLRVEGDLAEVTPENVFGSFLGRRRATVRTLVDALKKAKVDSRISSVLVCRIGLESPYWAKLQEVRDAILDFRTSGKRAIAYLEYGGDREYFVATSCDRIFLLPTSPLDLNGLATYELFLRGTLDKIGAVADLHHIGDYKTATEPAHREDLHARPSRDERIAQPRPLSPAGPRHRPGPQEVGSRGPAGHGRGPVPAGGGRARRPGGRPGVRGSDQRQGQAEHRARSVPHHGRRPTPEISPQSLGLATGPRIAVIYIAGLITSGRSGYDPLNGPVAGSDTIVDYVRRIRRDSSIRAIVVRIDSPGGSTIASDVMWRELAISRDREAGRPAGRLDVRSGRLGRLLRGDGRARHRRATRHPDGIDRDLRRQDRDRRHLREAGR